MADLEYNYTETGYCRVYYTWKNSEGQTVHYCAQEEGHRGIKFYRCSGGDWNEPDYEVKPLNAPPFSPGDTSTDKAVNEWIAKKWEVKQCGR